MSIQSIGEIPEPTHYPFPMARFGTNPYGENLFRIVFAPSVRTIVGGEFSDGYLGYRARPAHRDVGQHWILEKWISAYEHTGMDEETYNITYRGTNGMIVTGPYPHRGIYHLCETFAGSPGDGGIEKLVALILQAKKNDPVKNRIALRESVEKAERDEDAKRFDRVKDAMSAYGIRAANIGGHVKKTKTVPIMRTANELGLPVRGVTNLNKEMTKYGNL